MKKILLIILLLLVVVVGYAEAPQAAKSSFGETILGMVVVIFLFFVGIWLLRTIFTEGYVPQDEYDKLQNEAWKKERKLEQYEEQEREIKRNRKKEMQEKNRHRGDVTYM